MLLGRQPHTIEVDGKVLPVASVIRRGGALAVDLCVGIFFAMGAMWLVSRGTPLDSSKAHGPIVIIVLVVVAYLLIARDRFLPSLGRIIFALRLVRPSAVAGRPVASALARPLTVYEIESQRDEYTRTAVGVVTVVALSIVAVVIFAHALRTTDVYRAAMAFAAEQEPFASEHGVSPRIAPLPRALLVGKHKAYVQLTSHWGDDAGALDFFLTRDRARDPWLVREVRQVEPVFFGNYGLKVRDEDVPTSARAGER